MSILTARTAFMTYPMISFTGFLDVVEQTAAVCCSNQIATNAYSGDWGSVRVGAVNTLISFAEHKFNIDDWNTATNNGVDSAYGTVWYNQIPGEIDCSEIVEDRQPEVSSTGCNGVNTGHRYFGARLQPINDLTIIAGVKFASLTADQVIVAQDNIASRLWILMYHNGTNQLRLVVFTSDGILSAYIPNARTLLSTTTEQLLGVSYNSVTGTKLFIDGVSHPVTDSTSGTFNTQNVSISVGQFGNASVFFSGTICTIGIWLDYVTESGHAMIYNKWVENK